jgi:hypothetical protein
VTLSWDANPAGDAVTGYKLYFGSAPGVYNGAGSPISVGNVTSYFFVPGVTGQLYMALTAVNPTGESAFSNELSRVF